MKRAERGAAPASSLSRSLVTLIFWGGSAAALCGCGKRLEAPECDAMMDKYVELLARDDRPGASATELLRLQKDARDKAAHDPAFAECKKRVSRGAFECAMSAPNADRFEQCLL